MKISWQDTELETHKLELKDAVYLRIGAFLVTLNPDKSLNVMSPRETLTIEPNAANALNIKEKK